MNNYCLRPLHWPLQSMDLLQCVGLGQRTIFKKSTKLSNKLWINSNVPVCVGSSLLCVRSLRSLEQPDYELGGKKWCILLIIPWTLSITSKLINGSGPGLDWDKKNGHLEPTRLTGPHGALLAVVQGGWESTPPSGREAAGGADGILLRRKCPHWSGLTCSPVMLLCSVCMQMP